MVVEARGRNTGYLKLNVSYPADLLRGLFRIRPVRLCHKENFGKPRNATAFECKPDY
jgi:hypothetical protein